MNIKLVKLQLAIHLNSVLHAIEGPEQNLSSCQYNFNGNCVGGSEHLS